MKIEMVLPALYKAGMEVMAAGLTRGLSSRGHDVGLTCIHGGGAVADELRGDGYRVAVVPALGLRSILYAPQLEKWLRSLRPDVVHIHSGAWLKGARAARRAGLPWVLHTEHGVSEPETRYDRLLKRWAASFTDYVIAVSEPLRTHLTTKVGLDPKQIRVIPNGVNTDHFAPGLAGGSLRPRLGIGNERLVIGNIARLAPVKNHLLLIEAFARLRARVPEASLVIVGDGPMRAELRARISDLGLDSDAHLFGPVGDTAIVYRDFDLFVLSSTGEGTSMSILEAMASGVCVAATAVGGNPDLLGHGRYGVLVPSGDPAALAAAMGDLLRDAGRRRHLALDAREHVSLRYSEESMVSAYEQLYLACSPVTSARARDSQRVGKCAG